MVFISPPTFINKTVLSVAHRTISISVTVNGNPNTGAVTAILYNDFGARIPFLFFDFKSGPRATRKVVASEVDGRRDLLLFDYGINRNVAVRSVLINQDIDLQIDLNDGSTGGSIEPTELATAPAVIRVNKLPAEREIVALEKRTDGSWRFAGSTLISSSSDLELQVTGGEVYAVGLDGFGAPFQSGLSVDLGIKIRPSVFQGWLYECTEAGQLPSEEPDWWLEQGENPPRLVGTARLQAVRYYQPIAHGPIHYELI